MKKKLFLFAVLFFSISSYTYADRIIGKVSGEKKWVAYVSSTKYIFLKHGNTSFSLKCNTKFKVKSDYVLSPDGSSYTSNSQVLTAIQTRLVRGKYKSQGCK